MNREETSLGRLMANFNINDWDEIFPEKICMDCSMVKSCHVQPDACNAMNVISLMASKALSKGADSPKIFVALLKSVLNEE